MFVVDGDGSGAGNTRVRLRGAGPHAGGGSGGFGGGGFGSGELCLLLDTDYALSYDEKSRAKLTVLGGPHKGKAVTQLQRRMADGRMGVRFVLL